MESAVSPRENAMRIEKSPVGLPPKNNVPSPRITPVLAAKMRKYELMSLPTLPSPTPESCCFRNARRNIRQKMPDPMPRIMKARDVVVKIIACDMNQYTISHYYAPKGNKLSTVDDEIAKRSLQNLFWMLSNRQNLICITLDGEIEAVALCETPLSDISCLIIFFRMKRWMADIPKKKIKLLISSFS